jgi:hypothetical protein
MKFLIEKRANLELCDECGHSLFEFAVAGGNTEVISFLLSKGCEKGNALRTAILFHLNQLIPRNSWASDCGIVSQLSRLEHQISLKDSNLHS